jgi:hypothetical protein
MSVNGLVGSAAIALALAGTIAGACKRTGASGTPEMSAIPNNNSASDNAVSAFNSSGKSSRDLGTALAA